jgi:hypothetical protein
MGSSCGLADVDIRTITARAPIRNQEAFRMDAYLV